MVVIDTTEYELQTQSFAYLDFPIFLQVFTLDPEKTLNCFNVVFGSKVHVHTSLLYLINQKLARNLLMHLTFRRRSAFNTKNLCEII